jgi:hypothetical protein
LENHISKTEILEKDDSVTFTDNGAAFKPLEIDVNPDHSNLDFLFAKEDEHHLHSYFLQVSALQEKNPSSTVERYLQNVHGYLALSREYPTKLILSTSWDPSTVKDDKVYFYRVNSDTCQPEEPDVNNSHKIIWA